MIGVASRGRGGRTQEIHPPVDPGRFKIPYDPEAGQYTLSVPTPTDEERFAPGYDDLWIGFDDATNVRLRIEVQEATGE